MSFCVRISMGIWFSVSGALSRLATPLHSSRKGEVISEPRERFLAIDRMASLESSPLPASIARGLTDKLVERRKGAALELERSATVSTPHQYWAWVDAVTLGISQAQRSLLLNWEKSKNE